MAVSRGSVAFWVAFVRIHGRRQPITKRIGGVSQPADFQWLCPARPLSSASWALAPPNSLRYQTTKQPALSHPFHHASSEDDWEESLSVCVLVPQSESGATRTTVEIPWLAQTKLAELLTPGTHKSSELSFLLTTVDGSREDDISVVSGIRRSDPDCFRSLFETERCPAPFMYGSRFFCFHCPGTEPTPHGKLNSRQDVGLEGSKMEELQLPQPSSLCSRAALAEGQHHEGDGEREQKLAVVYERLRRELPNFLHKTHDYSMYSNDIEFINGLLNTKTRGRLVYQLHLSLWRLLCLLYFADVRLEVLKLTKHVEDGTIKARWRLRGLPLHSLILRIYRKDKSHLYRFYDAFSTFYVGHDGLIHRHKVEKVMPSQPPAFPRVTSLLASALVALEMEDNQPALNLLPLLLSSLRHFRD
uniref:uncharacterized protein C6orf136 homolog isoform X1 n=1 Tax=Doryrhamphus excisus TaxID=161450 RepID=UPI0025AE1733|nr:uncharacterized protein C6orf136 homolog isoform X1 [Doryrhamphus excisus]XP_057902632.1 uncharacterized protein C6orf136 homolog isoform X1 [Doryrhamphus excisus]XP_057902634.1 uncharacterized protein C6orf136 homolog isoform X1 [Doryrhamphus excisus]XP_057902635.1 uncharacterized protein C6orf136 homolog isoform X1 [Doryrhamphus excisus]